MRVCVIESHPGRVSHTTVVILTVFMYTACLHVTEYTSTKLDSIQLAL